MSLHPESMLISSPTSPGTPNVIRGKVLGANYLGGRTVSEVKTQTRGLLVSVQNDASQPLQPHKAFSEGEEIASVLGARIMPGCGGTLMSVPAITVGGAEAVARASPPGPTIVPPR